MKTKLILLLSLVLLCGLQSARAVLLIFPSGQTNTLSIPEGETWNFTFKQSSPVNFQVPIQFVQSGITNLLLLNELTILSGPASLIFFGTNQFAIAYKKMSLPMVQTVVLRPGETNTIDVPAGKTMKALNVPGFQTTSLTLSQGSNTFAGFNFGSRYDFDGPCNLQLSVTNTATTVSVLSYTFAEDFVAFPELGYLQTPKGDFEIVVEKTTNLTNWFPVLSHNTTSDQRAYYRFRIAK